MNHPVLLGGPARAHDPVSHPGQTLTNHRSHKLPLDPDGHETEIAIREILFHDEIRLQTFRPVVANPVLDTSPAFCQATQASPGSLPRSHPTGKREPPNQLPCVSAVRRQHDRLSPESFLEPSRQCLVLVLTDSYGFTIRQEQSSANFVPVSRQPAHLRVWLRKDHLNPVFLDNLVKAHQVSRAVGWGKLVGSVDPSIEFDTSPVYICSIEEGFLAIFTDPQAPANVVTRATSSTSDQNTFHYDTLVFAFRVCMGINK